MPPVRLCVNYCISAAYLYRTETVELEIMGLGQQIVGKVSQTETLDFLSLRTEMKSGCGNLALNY